MTECKASKEQEARFQKLMALLTGELDDPSEKARLENHLTAWAENLRAAKELSARSEMLTAEDFKLRISANR